MQNTPLKSLIDQHPLSYERLVILAMLNSHKFFLRAKSFVCPVDPKTGLHRQDFITKRFNYLVPCIDAYWGLFGRTPTEGVVPRQHLEAFMIDATNNGKIPLDIAKELQVDVNEDLYNLPMNKSLLEAVAGEAFGYWINLRVTKSTADDIQRKTMQGALTMEALDIIMQDAKRKKVNTSSRAMSGVDVLNARILFRPRFNLTSLKKLNLLLGGFARGETTMIAGTNGAGKTVMSCQMALDLALQDVNVAYITTEQKPHDLIQRMASNHLKTPFRQFIERNDVMAAQANVIEETQIEVIPRHIVDDPNNHDLFQKFLEGASRIKFIDWSNGLGLTVAENFAAEMEMMASDGFDPDVVILDWIGGGLGNTLTQAIDIRRIYDETAKFLIDWGKNQNKVVILMAQFNKTTATNKKKTRMHMLSECTTMSNNITNFIGISSMMADESDEANFAQKQYLNADKSRNATGGMIPVIRDFHIQSFREDNSLRT